MQCPVCKKTRNKNETFCSRCAWEFKMFVGGAPPEEEQRLKIAKRNWQQMLSGVTSNAKPDIIDDSDNFESLYSKDTPVPNLGKDAFETHEEFRKRIENHKPVLAGQAELLKDRYDMNSGFFPINISWMEWAESFVNKNKETRIIADRDIARSIYESGHEHPVYAFLRCGYSRVDTIDKIDLSALNRPFKIETSIFFQYWRRSQPFKRTLDEREEMQLRFNLDDNLRPKKYVKNEFKLIKFGKVVADYATKLMWQQGGSAEFMPRYGDSTSKYIQNLNSSKFAGFNDWRLPTIDELISLLTKNVQKNGLYIDPIFDRNQSSCFGCWSSDKLDLYHVHFDLGKVYDRFSSQQYVRAVRVLDNGGAFDSLTRFFK